MRVEVAHVLAELGEDIAGEQEGELGEESEEPIGHTGRWERLESFETDSYTKRSTSLCMDKSSKLEDISKEWE